MGKMKFTKSGSRIFANASFIKECVKQGKLSSGSVPRKVRGGYIAVQKKR